MRLLTLFCILSSTVFATTAPNFQGETMTGAKINLKDQLKPNRVLLVSFWASWCTPCLEEIEHVKEHLAKEPTLPLDVITVNVDTSETQTDVKPTVRLHKITFPVILDPKHEILSKYQQTGTIPFSVLIGPKGTIESTFNGFSETMFDKIKSVVAQRGVAEGPAKETNAKDKSK